MKIDAWVLSCEHGGRRVPKAYARLFASAGARAALMSHRGHDIGALAVARHLARALGVELQAASITRLLVDLNRSESHNSLFSEFSAGLDAVGRKRLLERYYFPYRQRLSDRIAAQRRGLVCHIAVHSFVPCHQGRERRADIGLLYDPRRPGERALCRRWRDRLRRFAPELRVRRNYPYLGKADGLTTALRRRFPADRYLGIELELNQALLGSRAGRRRAAAAIVASLLESCA